MKNWMIGMFSQMVILAATGCASNGIGRDSVVATSATVIGVRLGNDTATGQLVNGSLGYKRGEFAIVPTSMRACGRSPSGCKSTVESADVIMELHYHGGISSDSGVYQRLAVGETAVKAPGATALFGKDAKGQTSQTATSTAAPTPNEGR